jgi:LmbE family N-acetylglucosaminyl deacetylase
VTTNPLDSSVIVAAHPDDEALWFSSIIERVDAIVICFLDVESRPEWSAGRRASLDEYPYANAGCLGVTESEVFNGADWDAPTATDYGLRIADRGRGSVDRYRKNFSELKALLKDRLAGYANVYTHNPWGEYGHEEHVQVYRAVRDLRETLSFDLWYSSYFSNKSAGLMASCLARSPLTRQRRPTDAAAGTRLMELYRRHGCWTWYADYRWPESECFILDEKAARENKRFGSTLDLNFIKIWAPGRKKGRLGRRLRGAFRTLKGRPRG